MLASPPTLQIGNFPAPTSTMQAGFHLKSAVSEKYDIHHLVANSSLCIAQTIHVCFWQEIRFFGDGGYKHWIIFSKTLQNTFF